LPVRKVGDGFSSLKYFYPMLPTAHIINVTQGIATVLVAVVAFFTVYDFPETASFLSEEERAFVVFRLKYQSQREEEQEGAKIAESGKLSWKDVKAAFTDWQVWVGIWMFWGKFCRCFDAMRVGISN
jgi:hypothetical protein